MNAELNSIKGKKVLVIGDVMLDTYHIGDVKSPIYLFRRGNTNPSGPRRQLGRQTYRPENLSDRHGVLYAAADAPWVRVPAGRTACRQSQRYKFPKRNHTDPPC